MKFRRTNRIRRRHYGLTMFPGYADCPYHSPIRVDAIGPLGNHQFELRFLNLGYAAGVQDFTKRLRTLRRAHSHIVAAETEVPDRTYVIVAFNRHWLASHWLNLVAERYVDAAGRPIEQALLGLAASAI